MISRIDNKYIRVLVVSIVIIIAMIFVMDFSDFLDESSDKVIRLGVNPNCNSSIAICSASRNNEGNFQRISFTIKNVVVDEVKQLKMMLTARGFDFEGIESISVLFAMMDENSQHSVILLQPDKSSHQVVPENWHATTPLPLFDDNDSDWRAIIRLRSSKNDYRAEFPFNPKSAL